MQYLLTPLHEHFDFGFGATGNAFFDAAVFLDDRPDAKRDNLFNTTLPINFLFRHAIELFLKSAIVIFHRRFKLPYGEEPYDAEPMVLVGPQWQPFVRVHSVAVLWAYVRRLFSDHEEWLKENTKCDWQFAGDIDELVRQIDADDPRSTFFRYPTLKDVAADVSKSSMKRLSEDDFLDTFKGRSDEGRKGFGFVVQNERREFVRGYYFDDEHGKALNRALRTVARYLYDLHAALRWELCGGA